MKTRFTIFVLLCILAHADDRFAAANQTIDDNAAAFSLLLETTPNDQPRGIYVANMPGANFDAKLRAAVEALPDTGGDLHLPRGWHKSSATWLWHRKLPDDPSKWTTGHLLNQVTIHGHGCRILWVGPDNHAMWELLSPMHCRVEGPLYFVNHNGAKNLIAVYHRAGYEYRRNVSRCNTFDGVHVTGCWCAYYVGGPEGPDLTNTEWRACHFRKCDHICTAVGPNVIGHRFVNCNMSFNRSGLRLLGNSGLHFNRGEVRGPWGKSWAVDHFDTPQWKARIRGKEENPICGGGGPIVYVDSCTTAGNKQSSERSWLAHTRLGSAHVRDTYVEGPHTGLLLSEGMLAGGKGIYLGGRYANSITNSSAVTKESAIEWRGGQPMRLDGVTVSGDIRVAHRLSLLRADVRYLHGAKLETYQWSD